MKKKIIGVVMITTMAFAANWGIGQSKNKITLSDIALNNVEALARAESGSGCVFWCCQTQYTACNQIASSQCSSYTINLNTSC